MKFRVVISRREDTRRVLRDLRQTAKRHKKRLGTSACGPQIRSEGMHFEDFNLPRVRQGVLAQ